MIKGNKENKEIKKPRPEIDSLIYTKMSSNLMYVLYGDLPIYTSNTGAKLKLLKAETSYIKGMLGKEYTVWLCIDPLPEVFLIAKDQEFIQDFTSIDALVKNVECINFINKHLEKDRQEKLALLFEAQKLEKKFKLQDEIRNKAPELKAKLFQIKISYDKT